MNPLEQPTEEPKFSYEVLNKQLGELRYKHERILEETAVPFAFETHYHHIVNNLLGPAITALEESLRSPDAEDEQFLLGLADSNLKKLETYFAMCLNNPDYLLRELENLDGEFKDLRPLNAKQYVAEAEKRLQQTQQDISQD